MTVKNCLWIWLGDMWELARNDCGCCKSACPLPCEPGACIGYQVTTSCEAVNPPMNCTWTWLGDVWDQTATDCPDGLCDPPSEPGAFIGQVVTTPCLVFSSSSSSSPEPLNCLWTWTGDFWELTSDNCQNGNTCAEPLEEGAFIGQQVTTPCGTSSSSSESSSESSSFSVEG